MRGHMYFISLMALAVVGCGKISTKSKRSSNDATPIDAPASVEPANDSDDAIVGEDDPKTTADDPNAKPAMVLTGKDLYAKLCASCHGAFDESELGKVPMAKVRNAIFNVPDMTGLKDASEKDLEAIVAALSELSPGKGKDKKVAAAKN